MKSFINIDNWSRKEHFLFFKGFDEPFFGITTDVDCTTAYARAKEDDVSFFLYYLYRSLAAVNTIDEFRYRIEGDQVAAYEVINASPTVPRPDGTFGFSYMSYKSTFEDFYREALKEMERVKNSRSLMPSSNSENVVHYSALPWIRFTSLSHARQYGAADSVPKISFGRVYDQGNKKFMPMAVHVNHALMDGYHVGWYCDIFQDMMNSTS